MARGFNPTLTAPEKSKNSAKTTHFLNTSFLEHFATLNDPRIDPQEFQKCFLSWVKALAEKLEVEIIAIDGKTLKQSYDRNRKQKALHIVSAWSSSHP